MQGLQNGGGRQKPGSRTEALRFAVSLCALAGVINIAVRLIVLFLFRKEEGSYPGQYISDMTVMVFSMLLPVMALGYMGNGIKTYFAPECRRAAPLPSVLFVMLGFSGCVLFNDFVSLFDRFLPQADVGTIYITPDFGSFSLILISSSVFPAVCEEMLFRGYMYSTLSRFGAHFATVFSAFMFGFMHFSPSQMIFAFLCGYLLAYIRHVSGRFMLPVIIHFLNNAFSTVGTFIGLCCGTTAYAYYSLISHAILMAVFFGSAGLLIYGGLNILSFRRPRRSLTAREKLKAVVTTPALIIFVALAVIEKFV